MTNNKLDQDKSEWNIPRRGILKNMALVTGAFLTGVLRLDDVIGQGPLPTETGSRPGDKCCALCIASDSNCQENMCQSSLSWLCFEGTEIYRCVECYNRDVENIRVPDGEEIRCQNIGLCQYVVCSRAWGPNEKDPFK